MATVLINPSRLDHYDLFLKIKSLPIYSVQGRTMSFPDEYADRIGLSLEAITSDIPYEPEPFLFDYQADITRIAIAKRKFAVYAQCGLGKSLIDTSYARHVLRLLPERKCVLLVAPLMVVQQFLDEVNRFYGDSLPLEQIRARHLQTWLNDPGASRFGITNYESLTDELQPGRLGSLILSEASILKSHYGTYARILTRLGKGLDYKLIETGTPAPNDRIEYANHAVFLDQFPTTNAFLSRYFINRGQTNDRWELKPHALRPFYRSLSHWCIFLEDPATYGWRDNVNVIPPIHVHIHDVDLTEEQRDLVRTVSGDLYGSPGGITSRSKLSQLAKGRDSTTNQSVATNKPGFIRDLIHSWHDKESTIVWVRYNHEQDLMESVLRGAGSIRGDTPEDERIDIIRRFQSGGLRTLISKPSVLGFGLNFQIATRQVFNGLWDSAEAYYQAVKRSNRIGSTLPLNVHIPITEIERAMVETVFRKIRRMQDDTREQEQLFKDVGYPGINPVKGCRNHHHG